jgi:uncharacterized protein (DUF362 family)
MTELPAVAVLRSSYRSAQNRIEEALDLLGYQPQQRKVWLKPNLVTAPYWLPLGGKARSAITDLRFLEALLRIFADYEVVIAEGGLATYDTGATLERTGVAALARRYGARVMDLEGADRFEVPWAYGTLRLPALLRTHEYINVPKLKTHLLTGVTLGCKNQKGLLSSADKIRFHRELNLHLAIRALTDAVRPALTIVDGIAGMDLAGPTAGRTRRAGLVVAGRDLRAVDTACCDLISVAPEGVGHLDRVPYRTVGERVEAVCQRLDPAPRVAGTQVYIHAASSTCSRCLESMHEGSAALWRSPYHLLRGTWRCLLRRTDVVMGDHKVVPAGARGRVVCYGRCARKLAEDSGLPWIPGCPPRAEDHLALY